jgi:ATP-dependent DNA ligase
MLSIYDKGKLIPVGSAPATGKKRAEILERVEPLLGPSPERLPRGAPSRWKPKADLEWSPVSPELVVEVRYDKWQKGRFRHNSRFLRFRPDKDPEQCTVDQVRPRPKKGDPTVPGLLGRA